GPNDRLGTVAVFNPTPQPATGYVTATLPWNDDQPFVAAIGPEGERADVRIEGEPQSFVIPEGAPAGYDRQRAEIGFVARDVPGYGYKIYRLESGRSALEPTTDGDART